MADNEAMAVPIEDQANRLRAHYEDISMKASHWSNQIPVAIDLWEKWKKGELVEKEPATPEVERPRSRPEPSDVEAMSEALEELDAEIEACRGLEDVLVELGVQQAITLRRALKEGGRMSPKEKLEEIERALESVQFVSGMDRALTLARELRDNAVEGHAAFAGDQAWPDFRADDVHTGYAFHRPALLILSEPTP